MKWLIQILAAAALMPLAVAADQTSTVKPDGVVKAYLSTSEQTRIHVVGDRIRRMMAPPAGFKLENDELTGDVYLSPLPVVGSSKTAAAFLLTERGHTIQLRLVAKKKPADQIIITVNDGGAPVPVANRTVRNAPYVDEIVTFIGHVIRGEQPSGIDVRRGLNLPFSGGRTIEARWSGRRFLAEVVRVTANSGPLNLSETDFTETGVAAIWISARSLTAGETARVIIVRLRS